MVRGMNNLQITIHTLAVIQKVNHMEKEFMFGPMESSMKVNGIKVIKKVMEYGKDKKVNNT